MDRTSHGSGAPRMPMIEHKSQGDPCAKCGQPSVRHRVRPLHAPAGDPCSSCGVAASLHASERVREAKAAYDRERPEPRSGKSGEDSPPLFVGVDGEGHDVCAACAAPWGEGTEVCAACGCDHAKHLYTYLAAVDEHGEVAAETPYRPEGLSHEDCATMILSIPDNRVCFAFMFSYDVTKIVEDFPTIEKYKLLHPETRSRHRCKTCKKSWVGKMLMRCPKCNSRHLDTNTEYLRFRGRGYNFFNGTLTIAQAKEREEGKGWKKSRKIWDVFKFFGCSFVQAIQDWGTIPQCKTCRKSQVLALPNLEESKRDRQIRRHPISVCGKCAREVFVTFAQVDDIAEMKAKRGAFQFSDPEDVKVYCKNECRLLAVMMRRLEDAHQEAAIPLTSYFGAGSTAAALMAKYHVADYRSSIDIPWSDDLRHAIMSAFFGGRFENSVLGAVEQKIYNADIASAYPYAETFHPCLLCGKWKHVSKNVLREVQRARAAVVHFRVKNLGDAERRQMAWGPLPFRDDKGSICYPLNFEGWAWGVEVLSAIKGWPNLVEVLEAYTYDTPCTHAPFAFIPEAYRLRISWGKEGRGIVVKLGVNATYGKTAQDIGARKFQDFAWAGLTTATTRAQLLDAIAGASDRWNVLTLATDGITSTERLNLGEPRETGTRGCIDPNGQEKPPLGGWEVKEIPGGMFLAKPGMYWKLSGAEMSDLRARGIGRRELFRNQDNIIAAWDAWDRKDLDFGITIQSRRFFGAKQVVHARSECTRCTDKPSWPGFPSDCCPSCGRCGLRLVVGEQITPGGRPVYGTWGVRDIVIAFDPHPKRERDLPSGGRAARMTLRDVGGAVSACYKAGQTSPEGMAARLGTEEALAQPEWDEGGNALEEFIE